MANPEHLEILKQGVEVWNRWRKAERYVEPDLSALDLNDYLAELVGVNFRNAKLTRAKLFGANLKFSDLVFGDLRGADLRMANLGAANLTRADLSEANLGDADLGHALLESTQLRRSRLDSAQLPHTKFIGANLADSTLSRAILFETVFADADLSNCRGLETCKFHGPCTLDLRTLQRSEGLPPGFLRGCGLPEAFIEMMPSLLRHASEFCSCFISYSNADAGFAKRLHADLQGAGVRCWFAPEDMKIGDRIRRRLDESIRLHDKLLLILSETSLASQWIEQEVESALEKERRENSTVLFPIRLDDAVMDAEVGWPQLIRNTRYIGDFTSWRDDDCYQKSFERLLRDLRAEE